MEDINKLVNVEFTKIFNALNEQYFESKLFTPLFRLGNRFSISNGSIDDSTVVIAGQDSVFNMIINMNILDKPINEIASIICHNMIRYYEIVFSEQIESLTSNRGIYHNKNFKYFAEKCDLNCKRSNKYGWNITSPTSKFNEFCKKNNFKKTWKGVYSSTKFKAKSSTMTFACNCGRHKSVRVTSDPNLICGECNTKLFRIA